jgi:hypothetical protein
MDEINLTGSQLQFALDSECHKMLDWAKFEQSMDHEESIITNTPSGIKSKNTSEAMTDNSESH